MIDEAEARGDSKAADDLRYERYCTDKEAKGEVPRSREDWNITKERLNKNASRGREEERKGRESLEQHLGRPLKDNNAKDNNEDKVKTFTSSEGHITRPDSIGMNKNDEIEIVHDHKHHTGEGDQVIYNDPQMRAQKEMAKAGKDGRHIVTMSSDNPDLYGVPPKPRPSTPLGVDSEIYYTDPSSGTVTHKWVVNMKTGKGKWVKL
ncbi:ADP-ribosyltransferase [Paenibacillus sp. GCM10028914]|uniref:ADP-ribosyltransferase n=1 Tax=Paenibacillus sp. GCM10028914 TaxID=3273416 RepID=UPI0036162B23